MANSQTKLTMNFSHQRRLPDDLFHIARKYFEMLNTFGTDQSLKVIQRH